ncbi:MAG: hypothetical protein QXG86_02900 [Candidatus Woesearchaeota archaeon]
MRILKEFKDSFNLGVDYLKAVSCTIAFYAFVFMIDALLLVYANKKKVQIEKIIEIGGEITKTQLQTTALFSLLILLSSFVFILLAYITTTYIIYAILSKTKLSVKTALKFFPTFLIIILIFSIPLLFIIKLTSEQNYIIKFLSKILFFIVVLAYFHISNISYFFLAKENLILYAIKKSFQMKLKNFVKPYFFMVIVLCITLFFYKIIEKFAWPTAQQVIYIFIYALFINWLRFLIASKVFKKEKNII